MALSAGLSLADLSDYLGPGQECIKPVTFVEEEAPVTVKQKGGASTQIQLEQDENARPSVGAAGKEGAKKPQLKKAEITLNDCLACSGCITSAESVLVAMQSHQELYRALEEDPTLTPIASISPQSLASLGALHSLPPSLVLRGLRRLFKQHLGFRLVFDTTFARCLSLAEDRLDFTERLAVDASAKGKGKLPILSSSCPGWICYAEKTHGELLEFVGKAKSSQSVMGALVKHGEVGRRLGKSPERLYHVTVMPCFDKKLEASRVDFTTEVVTEEGEKREVRDVDCVLTTGEVQKMLDEKGLDLRQLSLEVAEEEGELEEETYFPSLVPAAGTSSGGYIFNAILSVLGKLDEEELARTTLFQKKIRTEDYIEYTLQLAPAPSSSSSSEEGGGRPKTLFKGAKCYGFRNLQNVVRKVGRDAGVAVAKGAAGRMPIGGRGRAVGGGGGAAGRRALGGAKEDDNRTLDYVEVMACPSGCLNGGGQILAPTRPLKRRKARQEGIVGGEGGHRMDEEGMPDVQSVELDAEEEEEEEERLFSAREWLEEVESTYWQLGGQTASLSSSSEQSMPGTTVLAALVAGRWKDEASAVESEVRRLVGDREGGVEEWRAKLLRTQYRPIESDEINGLAVKW